MAKVHVRTTHHSTELYYPPQIIQNLRLHQLHMQSLSVLERHTKAESLRRKAVLEQQTESHFRENKEHTNPICPRATSVTLP